MFWKIKNKLFGRDYVLYHQPAFLLGGPIRKVTRIYKDKAGVAYIIPYKSVLTVKHHLDNILWLTCPPDKYL